MKKIQIWANNTDAIDAIVEDLKKSAEEEPEFFGYVNDASENELYAFAQETNDTYLSDERRLFDDAGLALSTEIVAIASLELWNGIHRGYQMVESGKLSDCLQFQKDCDYADWFVDERGDFCSEQTHHDGTNCLTYRGLRPGVTENDIYGLCCCRTYKTEAEFRKALRRLTFRLGDAIRETYGSDPKFKGQRPSEKLLPRAVA